MLSQWDLNGIVLCHCNRFFHAAARALDSLGEASRERRGDLVALAGNLLWAQSPFISTSRGEEETLALVGAVAGTLGERALGEDAAGDEASAVVSEQERRLLALADHVVEGLYRKLPTALARDGRPSEVNQWVWEHLFPQYPYGLSTMELSKALRKRLEGAR